jgi:hypothetical protein
LAGTPFSLKKGALAPFSRKKGGTGPLLDTASHPFAEKKSSRQISNTDRKYRPPSKSDTGKIPIPKKLLVTPWYTTLLNSFISICCAVNKNRIFLPFSSSEQIPQ